MIKMLFRYEILIGIRMNIERKIKELYVEKHIRKYSNLV